MRTGIVDHSSIRPSALSRALATVLFALYKGIVSPLLVFGVGPACRFEPTCSEYAAQAVSTHGMARGLWMTLKRLLRCRPGGGWGYDPVTQINSRD